MEIEVQYFIWFNLTKLKTNNSVKLICTNTCFTVLTNALDLMMPTVFSGKAQSLNQRKLASVSLTGASKILSKKSVFLKCI